MSRQIYDIDKQELYQKYIIERLSTRATAKEFGCSKKVILDRLKEFNIQTRPTPLQININNGNQGYQELSGAYINRIKIHARDRNLDYNLTAIYLYNLFVYQQRKCALSGLDIKLVTTAQLNKGEQTASLDRINNKDGYIVGNVQWIHKDLQDMKWDLSIDKFIKLCSIIYYHNKDKYQL